MAILTFQVINYANCSITLSPGIPTLMDNYGNTQNVNSLNNATYATTAPPSAQSPVAIITNEVPPPANNMGNYLPNETITLDAYNSTGGFDVIPNAMSPNFPITSYTWASSSLTLPTTTGSSVTFVLPNVAAPETYTVQLTVQTAPNPADSSYVNSNTATITIIAQPQGPSSGNGAWIDVYITNFVTQQTQNSTYPYKMPLGYGIGSTCDSFAPQEQMNLTSFVSWNGGSVADKQVTFQVLDNNGQIIATFDSWTDATGYATYDYRLPWFSNNTATAQNEFGTWTVTASVDIAQNYAIDNMPFYFGDLLTMTPPTTFGSIERANPATPNSASTYSFNVPIQSASLSPKNYYLTYTVMDNNGVPVSMGMVQGTVAAQGTANPSVTLSIPNWAFLGTGSVKFDLFNYNPLVASDQALPYCPEQTTAITITGP